MCFYTGIVSAPICVPYVRTFLCAGTVNGDGQVAPIYVKVVPRITFAEKSNTYENMHFDSKMSLASWVPLGSSWAVPGCLMDAYWVFTAQEYIPSCGTNKHIIVQKGDVSSCSERRHVSCPTKDMPLCSTRRHVLLFNTKTCLLVDQEEMSS